MVGKHNINLNDVQDKEYDMKEYKLSNEAVYYKNFDSLLFYFVQATLLLNIK